MSDSAANVQIEDVLASVRRLVSTDRPLPRAIGPEASAQPHAEPQPAFAEASLSDPAPDAPSSAAGAPAPSQDAAPGADPAGRLILTADLLVPAAGGHEPDAAPPDAGDGPGREGDTATAGPLISALILPRPLTLEERIAQLEAAVRQHVSGEFEPDGSEDLGQHRPLRIFGRSVGDEAADDADALADRFAADAGAEPDFSDDEIGAWLSDALSGLTGRNAASEEAAGDLAHEDLAGDDLAGDDLAHDLPADDLPADDVASDDLAAAPMADPHLAGSHTDDGAVAEAHLSDDATGDADALEDLLMLDGDGPEAELEATAELIFEADDDDDREPLVFPRAHRLHMVASPADPVEDDPQDHDPAADFADETQEIDEHMLRDMVAEIVREELQGALGERITRNVRKLVRREIMRALSIRDFE